MDRACGYFRASFAKYSSINASVKVAFSRAEQRNPRIFLIRENYRIFFFFLFVCFEAARCKRANNERWTRLITARALCSDCLLLALSLLPYRGPRLQPGQPPESISMKLRYAAKFHCTVPRRGGISRCVFIRFRFPPPSLSRQLAREIATRSLRRSVQLQFSRRVCSVAEWNAMQLSGPLMSPLYNSLV